MNEMSKEEDTLERLESKIDRLSDLLLKTTEVLMKFSRDLTLILEERRKEAEKRERRTERRMFFRGLILGLVLGILGNTIVSYYVEYLKACNMPSWGWALGVVVCLLALAYIAWRFDIEIKKA